MTMEEIVKCFCGAESEKKALEKYLDCGVKRTPMAVKWGGCNNESWKKSTLIGGSKTWDLVNGCLS